MQTRGIAPIGWTDLPRRRSLLQGESFVAWVGSPATKAYQSVDTILMREYSFSGRS